MTIQIQFELSDKDLEHFRDMMKSAMENASNCSADEVISKAKQTCEEMESADLPDFVRTRLTSLELLIKAVEDAEWAMPEDEKVEVITSLAYFTEPQDLVPDHIPGLGYLDDAIMIELVIRDLSLDLNAYEQFSAFRKTEENRRGAEAQVNRESWLDSKRSEIRSTLRRKRQSSGSRKLFSRIM